MAVWSVVASAASWAAQLVALRVAWTVEQKVAGMAGSLAVKWGNYLAAQTVGRSELQLVEPRADLTAGTWA